MPFLRPRLKRLNAGSSSDLLHALDARQRSGCKYSKKSLNKILQQHAEDKSADSCFKNDVSIIIFLVKLASLICPSIALCKDAASPVTCFV